ncbi:MAG: hypothetical protein ABI042_03815 [Verrucomicrobiota bacterium]
MLLIKTVALARCAAHDERFSRFNGLSKYEEKPLKRLNLFSIISPG